MGNTSKNTKNDRMNLQILCEGFAKFSYEKHSTIGYKDNWFYELSFVIDGEWHLVNELGFTVLANSGVCLYKPGAVHQWNKQSQEGLLLRVPIERKFYEHWMSCCYPEFVFPERSLFMTATIQEEKTRYIKFLADSIMKGAVYPQYNAIEILFLAISSLLSYVGAIGSQNYVADIIYKLDTYYYIDSSVDEICSHYPCARPLLMQQFKDVTGTTIVNYKAKKKMEYAKQLLADTDMKIIDIANQLQFSGHSYFLQRFKEAYGITPSEYREQIRSNALQSKME